jgi:hypothetical protein
VDTFLSLSLSGRKHLGCLRFFFFKPETAVKTRKVAKELVKRLNISFLTKNIQTSKVTSRFVVGSLISYCVN